MTTLETAVRVLVDLLVRGDFATVEAVTRGRRLSSDELGRAVREYGRLLVLPPAEWWRTVTMTPLVGSPTSVHLAAPLWTAEEGRSDLTLELRMVESIPGVFDAEILDLRVL